MARNPLVSIPQGPTAPNSARVPGSGYGAPSPFDGIAPSSIASPAAMNRAAGFMQANGILRARFLQVPFTAEQGIASVLLPENPMRCYLFILNQSTVNQLYIGFDTDPSEVNGITIDKNLGFYEPWIVPINSINVSASGAKTAGTVIYAIAQ